MSISEKRVYPKLFLLIIFLFIESGATVCGQIIQTFSAEFSREYVEKNKKENISGKIYYDSASKKLVIQVNNPIKQWMILSGNETLIFYPETLQAFRIIAQNPAYMPFFQAFLGVIKEDYGLSELGYTFIRYERKGKTLVSHWVPPKNLAKVLGEFVLIFTDNKLTGTESKSPKGAVISKASYQNHFFFSGTYFPLEIDLTSYLKSGQTSEKVIYKNPIFNAPLPAEITGFKLPPEAKVKVVEW